MQVQVVTDQQAALSASHAEAMTVMGKMCKCGLMIKNIMKFRMITETAIVYRNNVNHSSITHENLPQCQILRAWGNKIWREVTMRVHRATVEARRGGVLK